ncbi:hypothetical protein MLD38_014464 [Melastoma candidum]|uniref:Uncharacterized protein n=1 Tax=Melastoma candidum TaxID=119954 RepID=A0ACB9RCH2_9MYRT|nr:hypothetical protein MLD38_014464 [Melastoma candidum]
MLFGIVGGRAEDQGESYTWQNIMSYPWLMGCISPKATGPLESRLRWLSSWTAPPFRSRRRLLDQRLPHGASSSLRIAVVGDVWDLEADTKALQFLKPDFVLFTGAPEDHLIIFLAHDGPTGLGSNIDDICGKDRVSQGIGDNGNPVKEGHGTPNAPGRVWPCAQVARTQKMIVQGDDGIIYLNGAIVPRVSPLTRDPNNGQSKTDGGSPGDAPDLAGTARAFTMVYISDKRVVKIAEIWVSLSMAKQPNWRRSRTIELFMLKVTCVCGGIITLPEKV